MKDIEVKTIEEMKIRTTTMPLIAIHKHPKDYPDKYVARLFNLTRPTERILIRDTLEDLQKEVAKSGLFFAVRDEEDDPCIVGTWI